MPTKFFRQILPMEQPAVRICLARFAKALARPATHENLAATQTHACLGLLNAFEFRLSNSHGATSGKTIHQVTFRRGLIPITNCAATLALHSREAAQNFSENFSALAHDEYRGCNVRFTLDLVRFTPLSGHGQGGQISSACDPKRTFGAMTQGSDMRRLATTTEQPRKTLPPVVCRRRSPPLGVQ